MKADLWTKSEESRRAFIGGSDARIIMGDDEAALLRLWRELCTIGSAGMGPEIWLFLRTQVARET